MLMRGRMSLQARIELAESGQLFGIEIACAGKGAVKYRRNMPVRQYKNILVPCFHIESGIVLHYFEIEGCKKFCTAKRSAGVTAGGPMNHANDVSANLGGNFL